MAITGQALARAAGLEHGLSDRGLDRDPEQANEPERPGSTAFDASSGEQPTTYDDHNAVGRLLAT